MEIPVTNVQRAIRFYREVFQWDIDGEGYDKQVQGVERVHFFSKGNFRGSFYLISEDRFFNMSEALEKNGSKEQGPLMSVTSTFAVEDMDDTLEKIVNYGGRIFQYVTSFDSLLDTIEIPAQV